MGSRGAACGDPNCPSGKPNGRGHWSHMSCRDRDAHVDHQHHEWSSEYTIYGPYWCEGYGVQAPPAEPSRKQYAPTPNAPDVIFWSEEEVRDWLDNDDTDAWVRTVTYSQWKRMPR